MKRTPATVKDIEKGSRFYFTGKDITTYTVSEIKKDGEWYDISCEKRKFPFRERGTKRLIIIEETT